jgi:UDP:flavonoid glycosyltransferase YjiC (YdhE family)
MLGLARALVDSGHTIRFATGAPLDNVIRKDGYLVDTVGLTQEQTLVARAADPVFRELVKVPRRSRLAAFSRSFAGIEVPPRVSDLRPIVRSWGPQLIVHDSADFAAPLVAALAGLPSSNHSFGPLVEANVMEAAGASAAEHWRANGLPVPDRGGMYRGLYLDIVPPSLQFPHISTVPSVQRLRPVPLQATEGDSDQWLSELGHRPVVLVTFGTIFNDRPGPFRTVIDGLRGLDADVVVAAGRNGVAGQLGELPDNVQVHEWVPWAPTLARSSVVVSHGGASSTLGPLAYGLPLVLIPMAADHFTNADAASRAGAAVVLDVATLSASGVRDAVTAALSQPLLNAARRISGEIAAMPSPAQVVPILEQLAG